MNLCLKHLPFVVITGQAPWAMKNCHLPVRVAMDPHLDLYIMQPGMVGWNLEDKLQNSKQLSFRTVRSYCS